MQLEKKLSSFGGGPLTHGALASMLKEYRSPNDQIVRLIDTGWLVPIKKGALRELLFDDLRLDEESITRFNPKVIETCIMPGMKEKMLLAVLELVNSMKRELK
ncbi:MAG: hypothetical protein FDX21_06290 [Chlorobium sp.]|nr:MAG: hypothetical protein FDX21_06290 [Chlorobium sp.]